MRMHACLFACLCIRVMYDFVRSYSVRARVCVCVTLCASVLSVYAFYYFLIIRIYIACHHSLIKI